MMFQTMRGMGQTPADVTSVTAPAPASPLASPMGSADCQWCVANPWAAILSPSCWAANFNGSCTAQSIPQAYVINSAPAAPPSQSVIDSQTPDQTINQILQQTQANAVAAASAADYIGPTDSAVNPLNLPSPFGISGTWILVGVATFAVFLFAKR